MSRLHQFPVVEIASTYATMHAGRLLAEAGLPVLRIEVDDEPPLARFGPRLADGRSAADLSANLKKDRIRLDPDRADALVRRLAAAGSVFLTDRARYDDVRGRIVTCRVLPYRGTTGGVFELPSSDVLVQAAMGGAGMTGRIGGSAMPIGFPIGDLAPGMYAAIGTMNALLDGRPQRITIDSLDATVSLLTYFGCSFCVDGEDVGFIGSGHPYIVPYGAYTASDGYVIVAAFNQDFWRKLCKLLGRADLTEDPRYKRFTGRRENRVELNALLDGLFRQRTVAEWVALLQQADVPNAPVFSMRQALEHDVVRQRHMVTRVDGLPMLDSPMADVGERRAGGTGKRPLARDLRSTLAALGVGDHELRAHVIDLADAAAAGAAAATAATAAAVAPGAAAAS